MPVEYHPDTTTLPNRERFISSKPYMDLQPNKIMVQSSSHGKLRNLYLHQGTQVTLSWYELHDVHSLDNTSILMYHSGSYHPDTVYLSSCFKSCIKSPSNDALPGTPPENSQIREVKR